MNNDLTKERRESNEDADPMIDALLGEFVPSEPGRRRCPPDLTAAILEKLSASEAEPQADVELDHEADPIIDSLLAEFLPSEPEKKSSPPDLCHAILKRLAADGHEEPGNEIDNDPVVDALLPEFVPADSRNRTAPPDLAGAIVTQLVDGAAPPIAAPESSIATPAAESATAATVSVSADSARWNRRFVAVVTAIAASVIGLIWYSSPVDTGDRLAVETTEPSGEGSIDSIPGTIVRPESDTSPATGPMLADSDPTDLPSGRRQLDEPARQEDRLSNPDRIAADPVRAELQDPSVLPGEDSDPPAAPIALVARKGSQTAKQYWTRMGIEPTPDASADEIAGRMKARLGVDLPREVLNDPERLHRFLAQEANADELAKRWLALTANRQLKAIDRVENEALLKELSNGVSGDVPFDETLVSLIDGSNSNSESWYGAIGVGGTEAIAKHLARLSFNADLRCVRCHDSHIGRSGTQDDYWSFVALVRKNVQRSGPNFVVSERPSQTTTFYELLDGRQRMASAKVSGYLFRSEEPITDFKEWTRTLAGSDALAGSMVDSLWALVHGRSLKPSPVDALAPPYDSSLDDLHRLLTEDLKASQFDVSRTLALIVASPMARRSVPESLRGDAIMTTSDREQAEALQLVSAFAASVETPSASLERRIDVAMRRVGGKLIADDQGTMLAQPITEDPRDPKARNRPPTVKPVISLAQKLAVDFPGDDASLPVGWLRTMEDFELQLQHLAYLSGRKEVPAEVSEIAERLEAAGSRESALSRLWWILRQ